MSTEFSILRFPLRFFSFKPDHGSSYCGENDSVLPYQEEVAEANPAHEIPAPLGFAILLYLLVQVQAGI